MSIDTYNAVSFVEKNKGKDIFVLASSLEPECAMTKIVMRFIKLNKTGRKWIKIDSIPSGDILPKKIKKEWVGLILPIQGLVSLNLPSPDDIAFMISTRDVILSLKNQKKESPLIGWILHNHRSKFFFFSLVTCEIVDA